MGLAAAVAGAAVVGAVGQKVAQNTASKAQPKSTDKAIASTQEAASQGRQDVTDNMALARQQANLGFQGGLDVFGQSAPAQMDVFQQGNLGAQQQLLAGLPQIQNAILGGNVDLSGLQPFQVQQPGLSFLQQTLPVMPQSTPADAQAQLQIGAASTGPFRGMGPNIGNVSGNILGGGTAGLGGNMQTIFRNQER